MPKGFYVARARAVQAIALLEVQTALGSGYRFHESVKNHKLSIYTDGGGVSIPNMLAQVTAWAARNTDYFRPGFLPSGDDMVVISDDLSRVCFIALVNRAKFDSGSMSHVYTVYNQILWADVGWSRSIFKHPKDADWQQEQKYIMSAIGFAGATIVTTAVLQERIASGMTGAAAAAAAAGADADGFIMTLNPLFAGGKHA